MKRSFFWSKLREKEGRVETEFLYDWNLDLAELAVAVAVAVVIPAVFERAKLRRKKKVTSFSSLSDLTSASAVPHDDSKKKRLRVLKVLS